MSSLCRVSVAGLVFCSALLASPALGQPLRICAEPDNLPFSHHDGRGFEVAVARILAHDLQRPLEMVYVAQRTPDFLRSTINAGVCDALMSVPAGFNRLATTASWYRSQYLLVSRKRDDIAASLDVLRLQDLVIGVAGRGTPAALALARHGLTDNVQAYSVFDARNLVADVDKGVVDLALVWGPFAGWHARQSAQPLMLAPLPGEDPLLAFDIAIGVRKGNEALRQALDDALARHRTAIAEILQYWHVQAGK